MDSIILHSVTKTFRQRPGIHNWLRKNLVENTRALDDVSLRVARGTTLAVLGPNGSGKTTLLKLIAAMLLPDEGSVSVNGYKTSTDGGAVRKQVGFLIASERSFYPRLSVRENLCFFASMDEVPRPDRRSIVDSLLLQLGLSGQGDTLAMRLSSGMYQKLAIARVLLKRPAVILLDEPTRSLDAESTEEFWTTIRSLRDEGISTVVATHNFEEALALGDSVAILCRGHLLEHRASAASTSHQLRSLYMDVIGSPRRHPQAAAAAV